MKQQILKSLYSVGGFRPFHFLNRKKILILTYHRFSELPDDHAISASEFEDHLKYLKALHHVISLDDAVKCLSEGAALPPNPAVITIDDGYRDVYEIAYPLLQRYSIPATLFVITDFLDGKSWLWTDMMRYVMINTAKKIIDADFGPLGKVSSKVDSRADRLRIAGKLNEFLKMLEDSDKSKRIHEIAESLEVRLPDVPTSEFGPVSWDQAREMDAGCVQIESHTASHPILTNIDNKRLRLELENSKAVLFERLGRLPRHFCYPNGTFNKSVRKAVVEAGFVSAVTTNYGFCDSDSDLFSLKRIDGQPAISSFAQSASGFEGFREKVGI